MFPVSVYSQCICCWRKACDIAIILYLICNTVLLFYINLCVNSLNMFTKHEFKFEIFVAVCLNNVKGGISIVRSIIPLVDHSVVKISI